MKKSLHPPSTALWGKLLQLIAPSGAYKYLYTANERTTGKTHWRTEKFVRLTPQKLASGKPFGVRPSRYKTSFLVIDIDRNSNYHPKSDNGKAIEEIRSAFRDLGLECIALQSTVSTGIHLWFPLKEINTKSLVELAEGALTGLGLRIAPGQLEIFPNRAKPGSEMNGIRIPLTSEGSWMLNDDLDLISTDLEAFCAAWENLRDINQIEISDKEYKDGYFRNIRQAKERLNIGFTDYGQTDRLAADAGYIGASRGYKGAALRSFICTTLADLKGFRKYCRHTKEILARTFEKWWRHYSRYAKSCKKGVARIRDRGRNSRIETEAKERIVEACRDILYTGRKFRTVTEARQGIIRNIREKGGTMSLHTVRKYPQLVDDLITSRPGTTSRKDPIDEVGGGVTPTAAQRVSYPSPSTDGWQQERPLGDGVLVKSSSHLARPERCVDQTNNGLAHSADLRTPIRSEPMQHTEVHITDLPGLAPGRSRAECPRSQVNDSAGERESLSACPRPCPTPVRERGRRLQLSMSGHSGGKSLQGLGLGNGAGDPLQPLPRAGAQPQQQRAGILCTNHHPVAQEQRCSHGLYRELTLAADLLNRMIQQPLLKCFPEH